MLWGNVCYRTQTYCNSNFTSLLLYSIIEFRMEIESSASIFRAGTVSNLFSFVYVPGGSVILCLLNTSITNIFEEKLSFNWLLRPSGIIK